MQALIIQFADRGLKRTPHQRGQTLILVLLLVGVAVGAALFSFFSSSKLALERNQKTAAALAQAKAALIGYAANNPNQPGILPCPDSDNDGSGESPCGATGVTAIGRLPWKTLGLPDLRDGSGECLWYAVSANFKNSGMSGPSTLNSDSAGTLVVNDTGGTPVYSGSNAVLAIVFAPGGALSGQNRSPSSTTVCGGNTTVANYLEGGNENGAATNTFVSGQAMPTFNDRVLVITRSQLIPIVEQRVAKELMTSLADYRAKSTCGCYPWAASFNIDTVAAAVTPNFSNPSVKGYNRGRLPLNALPENWGTNSSMPLPSWFGMNNWHNVIYYSVAKQNADNQGGACNTCTGTTLTVNGTALGGALFFTPGTPHGAIVRPSNNLADYLTDPQNRDGDDVYVTPAATTLDRNRIFTLASSAAPLRCANNAAQLFALAPCGSNPQCATLAANLATCTCAAAATTLINVPCANTLTPPKCQDAVATLSKCNF